MERSENEFGAKHDRRFADSFFKISSGLAIGVAASVAYFKGRTAPIWLGAGVGLGIGLSNNWSNNRHVRKCHLWRDGKKVKTDADTGDKQHAFVLEQPSSAT